MTLKHRPDQSYVSTIVLALLCFYLAPTSAKEAAPNTPVATLSQYSEVTIKNFSDGTEKSMLPRYIKKQFATELAKNLIAADVFQTVKRSSSAKSGLLVDGRVLEYVQTNQRVIGVGSSQFKIRVKLIDAASGELIDSMILNRDSHDRVGAKFKLNQERVETYIDEVLHELTINLITAKLTQTEPVSDAAAPQP